MIRIPKTKTMMFSCHGSHTCNAKDNFEGVSNLFKDVKAFVKLSKSKESISDSLANTISTEILNRTVLVNLASPGELQYDEPNIPMIEVMKNVRIFWTFAYDFDLKTTTEDNPNILAIKKLLIEELLKLYISNIQQSNGNLYLTILYTTAPYAPKPPNIDDDDVYSHIEFINPAINSSNVFDFDHFLDRYQSVCDEHIKKLKISGGGKRKDIERETECESLFQELLQVKHTRFYIGIRNNATSSNLDSVYHQLKEFYQKFRIFLSDLYKSETNIRKYSNNLTYFSPNILEVSRSFTSLFQSIQKTQEIKEKIEKHPYSSQSEIVTGYQLLAGPDYRLSRSDDEIEYKRFVNGKSLRFGTTKTVLIINQLKKYFGKYKDLEAQLPNIPPYVMILHTCNQCMNKEDYDSGTCECFFNIEPEVIIGEQTFTSDENGLIVES